jgi:CheY-like chemotaxis protein
MAYRVLVIEDNTDCRELFAMMVRHLGCEVLQADDGELGVQKALSENPDLIFMDIGMPNMNGMDAVSCLRESAVTKNTPIVIYTAWMGEKYRDAALKCGAHEVVTKPMSFDELQRVLLRYIPTPSTPTDVQ